MDAWIPLKPGPLSAGELLRVASGQRKRLIEIGVRIESVDELPVSDSVASRPPETTPERIDLLNQPTVAHQFEPAIDPVIQIV